jgi:hypothetical protein
MWASCYIFFLLYILFCPDGNHVRVFYCAIRFVLSAFLCIWCSHCFCVCCTGSQHCYLLYILFGKSLWIWFLSLCHASTRNIYLTRCSTIAGYLHTCNKLYTLSHVSKRCDDRLWDSLKFFPLHSFLSQEQDSYSQVLIIEVSVLQSTLCWISHMFCPTCGCFQAVCLQRCILFSNIYTLVEFMIYYFWKWVI